MKDFNKCLGGKELQTLTTYEQNKLWHKYYTFKSKQTAYNISQAEVLNNKKMMSKFKSLIGAAYCHISQEQRVCYEDLCEKFYDILVQYCRGKLGKGFLKITFDIDSILLDAFFNGLIEIKEFKGLRSKCLWTGKSLTIPKLVLDEDSTVCYSSRKNGVELIPLDFKLVLIKKIDLIVE